MLGRFSYTFLHFLALADIFLHFLTVSYILLHEPKFIQFSYVTWSRVRNFWCGIFTFRKHDSFHD